MTASTSKPDQPAAIEIPSKPQRIKLTQDIDFFALFKRIEHAFETCYLLESLGEDGHMARHHAIGFDPVMTIAAIDRTTLAITDNKPPKLHYQTDNPYQLLRSITPQHVIARDQSGGLLATWLMTVSIFLSQVSTPKPVMISNPSNLVCI